MMKPDYENQNCDMTLNSQIASPDEEDHVNQSDLEINRRGSNFQSNNAFDESI